MQPSPRSDRAHPWIQRDPAAAESPLIRSPNTPSLGTPPCPFAQGSSAKPQPVPPAASPRAPRHARLLTVFPHDQDVAALVLGGEEDLRHHDEDLALGRRVDVPGALDVGGVVPGVVGGLDVAGVLAQLPPALPVCKAWRAGLTGNQWHSHGDWEGLLGKLGVLYQHRSRCPLAPACMHRAQK